MNCLTAQGMIQRYVNKELKPGELESFLNHIDNCKDCYEELQIYYILFEGMHQLENDKVVNYNFNEQFLQSLEKSRQSTIKSNLARVRKVIALEIIVVIFPLIFTYSYDRDQYYEDIVYTDTVVSNYHIDDYFDIDNKLDEYIDNNIDKIDRYLKSKGVNQKELDDNNAPSFTE